ncbi:MAG: terminase small subunit [Alphaproteobacteria bacterium]
MRDLTDKQYLFVIAFVANGGNATAAATTAGYSDASAREQGWRLVHKPHVLAAVQEAQRKAIRTLGTEAIEVLAGLMRTSHSDRVRLAAADSILDRAGLTAKAAETENLATRKKPISDMSAEELAALMVAQRATVRALEAKMVEITPSLDPEPMELIENFE